MGISFLQLCLRNRGLLLSQWCVCAAGFGAASLGQRDFCSGVPGPGKLRYPPTTSSQWPSTPAGPTINQFLFIDQPLKYILLLAPLNRWGIGTKKAMQQVAEAGFRASSHRLQSACFQPQPHAPLVPSRLSLARAHPFTSACWALSIDVSYHVIGTIFGLKHKGFWNPLSYYLMTILPGGPSSHQPLSLPLASRSGLVLLLLNSSLFTPVT